MVCFILLGQCVDFIFLSGLLVVLMGLTESV